MPIDILGRAMYNNVRPQLQRLLKIRTGKGVIHNNQQLMAVRNLCDCPDIHQSEQRIGRSLQPHHLRIWPDGLFVSIQIAGWHIAGLDSIAAHHTLKDSIAATVQVITGDDVITCTEQAQDSAFSRHAGSEG